MKKTDLPAELTTPIILTGESELDRLRELHEQRLKKAHLLLDFYGAPEELREEPAQQWYWLAVTLAKERFTGFTVAGDPGRPDLGPRAWKFYAEVRRLMRQQNLSKKKAISKLVDNAVIEQRMHAETMALCEDQPVTDSTPPPDLPDFLTGPGPLTDEQAEAVRRDLFTDEGKAAKHATLRRRFYAVQKSLKSRCESVESVPAGPHYHGAHSMSVCTAEPCNRSLDERFEDMVSVLIWKLDKDPEFFESLDIEESYRRLVAHSLPR